MLQINGGNTRPNWVAQKQLNAMLRFAPLVFKDCLGCWLVGSLSLDCGRKKKNPEGVLPARTATANGKHVDESFEWVISEEGKFKG